MRRSPWLVLIASSLVLCFACAEPPPKPDAPGERASPAAPPSAAPAAPKTAEPLKLVPWTGQKRGAWAEVKALEDQQKVQAALERVAKMREAARVAGDSEEFVRAVVATIRLRTGLHGYETAVRFLDELTWPDDLLGRTTLHLFYAQALMTYARSYAWEIRQREEMVTKGPIDLKRWTWGQIHAHADRQYHAAWMQRESLGAQSLAVLDEYLLANDFPRGIRATTRDAVVYLWAARLADTSTWRPEHQGGLHALDLDALLADADATPALLDPAVHPLRKIAALLAEHAAWHRAAGRDEAAFEADRVRLERLFNAFTDAGDRARISARLKTMMLPVRDHPWWAMGMATLAGFSRTANALVDARRIAQTGAAAYPNDVGGQRCRSIVEQIEHPAFTLDGMSQDAPGRRSVGVTHKNLGRLYFRAWKFDLHAYVRRQKDYRLLPDRRFAEPRVDERAPDARWLVDLPPTPDFQTHRTWVTPPMSAHGSYLVAASPDPEFDRTKSPVQMIVLTLSDLVVLHRTETRAIEAQVVSGQTGAPIPDAVLTLYKYDWRSGHEAIGSLKTDADGLARFTGRPGGSHFLLARQGRERAMAAGHLQFGYDRSRQRQKAALIYTDRSVYRPGQTVHWQAVAWQGRPSAAELKVAPKMALTVRLRDGNREIVEEVKTRTNAFGSAAGTFVIPAGRALGAWRIESNVSVQGGGIRVEEYKRPTFEAELPPPKDQLRLNTPATLTGQARYYFGLPVTAGKARWRVVRSPVLPWWFNRWWHGGNIGGNQVVATGVSPLDDSGEFTIAFTPEADPRLSEGKGRAVTYRYAISADVTDEGGETRSAQTTIQLGFVSVAARIDLPTEFLVEGEAGAAQIHRATLDGQPLSGAGSYRLVQLTPPDQTPDLAEVPAPTEGRAHATPGDAHRPRWAHGYNARAMIADWPAGAEVAAGALTHGADGEAAVPLRGLAAGAYRLIYNTKDAFGGALEEHRSIVVVGMSSTLPLPVDLRVEKPAVAVGETLRIWAHAGDRGQPMYLDRWRAGVRVERRLILGGEGGLIELPITEADRGGLGLTLQWVRDHQHVRLQRSVRVPWTNREMTVRFATFRDRLRPGQKETWTIKVEASEARRAATEVLAYMYDKSLDLFAPHLPPSPLPLLPWRGRAPMFQANLGRASRVGLRAGHFPPPAGWPGLRDDRLRFLDGYAIGGPGRRMRLAARGEAFAAAAPASAPEPEASADAPVAENALDDSKLKSGAMAVGGSATIREKRGGGDAQAAPQPTAMRSNFAETAFFQPQLRLGADGTVDIVFEVPDSVTAWNVWVHAISDDLSYGRVHAEAKTVKTLMVRPYLPRFLREGDQAEVEVVINNAGDTPLEGTLDLSIEDPETKASLLAAFGLEAKAVRGLPFTVAPGKSARQRIRLNAPAKLLPAAFVVTARAGDQQDGERRPLPVLPGRVHLAQSRFTTLKGVVTKTLRFADLAKDDDPTRLNEQLVVTLDGQLFHGVLAALPYLINYAYECTEQTLNRFVSTGILSSLFAEYPAVAKMAKTLSQRDTATEAWGAPDPNRKLALEETPWLQSARGGAEKDFAKVLDPRVARAQRRASLARLRKSQTSLGGFPWWSGGPPSPYMTLYILHGFAKAKEFGVAVPKDMTQRAWRYLERHEIDRAMKHALAHDCCWSFITTVNYVLSMDADLSWTGGVFSAKDRAAMLDLSFRHWKKHSPMLKGYLALTLHRSGRAADARLVWASVLDSAQTAPDQGTFWAPEDRAWLWYNDTIETHAFALRATLEIEPEWPQLEGLVLWLFLNKKLNHWKSTRATAEVIYSLAHYLRATDQLAVREETEVRIGARRKTFVFEPEVFTGKKNQVVVPGAEIDPKVDSAIVVEKRTKGFQLASATWHFSTERMPTAAHGDFLAVTRTYYKRIGAGRAVTLEPLAEGATLAVGDEVEVHLSLRSKHALEYVHLRDPRGAGFEPASLRSQHKWDLGLRWFEEVRDSATNFFFEALPRGEYTFKYRLRATTGGAFKVGPATVQPMYAPEFNAYSAGHVLRIAPGAP